MLQSIADVADVASAVGDVKDRVNDSRVENSLFWTAFWKLKVCPFTKKMTRLECGSQEPRFDIFNWPGEI